MKTQKAVQEKHMKLKSFAKLMGYMHEFLVPVLKGYCSSPPKTISTESMLKTSIGFLSNSE